MSRYSRHHPRTQEPGAARGQSAPRSHVFNPWRCFPWLPVTFSMLEGHRKSSQQLKGNPYLLEAFAAAVSSAPFLNSDAVRLMCPTDCAMITLPFGTLSS